MTTLAIIPARGGSKGIPQKNIVPFAGKPLIAWTIEAALDSGADRVIVSTDSQSIADVARAWGAEIPFMRPDDLSGDKAGSLPVALHALSQCPAETIIFLQPTSPLRTAIDIRESMALHLKTDRPVVSVYRTKPWLFTMGADGSLDATLALADQRQDSNYYAPNGAIYIAASRRLQAGETWWSHPIGFEMPPERSIDIDDPSDLIIAEALFLSGRAS